MPIFSYNEREAFEEMIAGIQACTFSTEMLFREESILADTVEEMEIRRVFSIEEIVQDSLYFPENWA